MQADDIYRVVEKKLDQHALLRSRYCLAAVSNPRQIQEKVMRDLLLAVQEIPERYDRYLKLREQLNAKLPPDLDAIYERITREVFDKVVIDDPELRQAQEQRKRQELAARAAKFSEQYGCGDCGHDWDANPPQGRCPECGSHRLYHGPILPG